MGTLHLYNGQTCQDFRLIDVIPWGNFAGKVVPPWKSSPGALFSLWDMKDFYAQYFFLAAKQLQALLDVEKVAPILSTSSSPKEKKIHIAQITAVVCQHLEGDNDFRVAYTLANRLRTLLSFEEDFTYEQLFQKVRSLQECIESSLMQIHGLHVPFEEAKY